MDYFKVEGQSSWLERENKQAGFKQPLTKRIFGFGCGVGLVGSFGPLVFLPISLSEKITQRNYRPTHSNKGPCLGWPLSISVSFFAFFLTSLPPHPRDVHSAPKTLLTMSIHVCTVCDCYRASVTEAAAAPTLERSTSALSFWYHLSIW